MLEKRFIKVNSMNKHLIRKAKKIDYLFMPHIVFLFRKVRKMILNLLNNSKESVNHAFL